MATEIKGMKPGRIEQMDPVCGALVISEQAYKTTESGTDYYFCSKACLDKFESDPSAFTHPDKE